MTTFMTSVVWVLYSVDRASRYDSC